MQGRLAAGACRATVVRAALHVIAGGRMLGDAAGDGVGQHAPGAAAGDHAVYHGKRGEAGAGGDQRATPDR